MTPYNNLNYTNLTLFHSSRTMYATNPADNPATNFPIPRIIPILSTLA